jgi:hypothetical protein
VGEVGAFGACDAGVMPETRCALIPAYGNIFYIARKCLGKFRNDLGNPMSRKAFQLFPKHEAHLLAPRIHG